MSRSEFRTRVAHSIIWLAVASHVLGAIVGLIRLYYRVYWVGHYPKIINFLVVALCLMLFVSGRMRVDSFSLLVGMMILLAIWTGAFWSNGNVFFVSHLFSGLLILASYTATSNYLWAEEELDVFVERASLVLLCVLAAMIGLFWLISLFGARQLYLGISTNILILPLAHYALRRRPGMVALTALLVFAAGKRASYANLPVALMLVLPQYLGWTAPRGKDLPSGAPAGSGAKLLAASAAIAVFAAVSFLLIATVDLSEVPVLGNVADKWEMVNPLVYGLDLERLNLGSGQRIYEIVFSWREFASSGWHWLIGRGYGWTYDSPIFYEGTFESHYIHFSPLNLVYQHGAVLAGLFFLLLAYKILWIGNRLSPHGGSSYALWISLVGLLVTGLFGYSYGTDPTIWLILGVITSRARQRAAEAQQLQRA